METAKKYKILIVDDDQFLLNMYSFKFGKENFDVTAITGGEEALRKLREGFNPDVLLLDVIMPTVDGNELLNIIRKENLAPRAAIIMLTNQSKDGNIVNAKSLGIDGYIIKATTIPSEVVEEVLKITRAKNK